mmetsp:Transcript_7642/g.22646  ORF Transcript_7642/g.22646 Transcript_7642/m.22646 type:complete len:200 (+) Transcript_7642:160-759(+)
MFALRRIACTRPLSASSTSPLSTMVLSVTGADAKGIVATVTDTIAKAGGNVVESNSLALGPVFSMALMVDVGHDQHTQLADAVQRALPLYAVSGHDASASAAEPAFAATLDVTCADGPGLIAQVTEFVNESGLSLAKLETKSEGAPHGGTTLFSMSGTMLSSAPVDEAALAAGFADLETKMGISIEYAALDAPAAALAA